MSLLLDAVSTGMLRFMTSQLLTPACASAVVELADGLFRKQILPFGSINYTAPNGSRRRLTFDRKFHEDLVSSYRSGAFGQVPFQLADAKNAHTNDPERTRGEITGVEMRSDGLYALVKPMTPEAAELIRTNPKLGVSVRVVENYQRSDGQFFPRALQHVLGTLDPQVVGMKPWEEVQLTDPVTDETIDLTASTYEGTTMGDDGTGGTGQVTLTLDAAQADRLALLLNDDDAAAAALAGVIGLANGNRGTGDDDDDEPYAGLAPEVALAIEMANANAEAANQRVAELANQLATAQVAGEVERYGAAGLAPAIIDAARPLLAVQSGAIDLSNGADRVDPGAVIRSVLDTVLGLSQAGLDVIDLGRETGSLQGSENDPATQTRNALLSQWSTDYGN